MDSLQETMLDFRMQLEKGTLIKAYQGLMDYLMELRRHFAHKYPEFFVSGSIYQGYMDMSYFSFTPRSLRERNLKIAIVFVFELFRFEVWLGGNNKSIQKEYWQFLKDSRWDKYHLVPNTAGADSILEHVIAADPDFRDLDALTSQIEHESLNFIQDVEKYISDLPI